MRKSDTEMVTNGHGENQEVRLFFRNSILMFKLQVVSGNLPPTRTRTPPHCP